MIAILFGIFSILGTDFTSRSSGQRCPLPRSMIGPLAMLISGMLIAGTTPQEILAFPHIGLVTILRLIGVPLLTILLLKFSGLASFAENGSQILLVTLLATITPSASTITQMAQVYGKDARYAGAINVITTLLLYDNHANHGLSLSIITLFFTTKERLFAKQPITSLHKTQNASSFLLRDGESSHI